jgi:hypothetical protein
MEWERDKSSRPMRWAEIDNFCGDFGASLDKKRHVLAITDEIGRERGGS